MARILYSTPINEIKGSVGGLTFQRNPAGTICKLKPSRVFNLTIGQLLTTNQLQQIIVSWNGLSSYNKSLWQAYAVIHTKDNYWGETKKLTGYNWFLSINTMRILTSQSILSIPEPYDLPPPPQISNVQFAQGVLSVNLTPVVYSPDNVLIWFCTPVIRNNTVKNRKDIRLTLINGSLSSSLVDLQDSWCSLFNYANPLDLVGNGINIVICCATINKVNGQVSSFAVYTKEYLNVSMPFTQWSDCGQMFGELEILSISSDNGNVICAGTAPHGKITRSIDQGNTWSDLGQQFGQNAITSLIYVGTDNWLAGTSPGGLILRSMDNGATWQNMGKCGNASVIYSLVKSSNYNVIACTDDNGYCFYSNDLFSTYNQSYWPSGESVVLSSILCSLNTTLYGTGNNANLGMSSDNGLHINTIRNFLPASRVVSLASIYNDIILLGTYNNGHLFRSSDHGLSWSDMGKILNATSIPALCSCASQYFLMSISPGGLILISSDGGQNFINLGNMFGESQIFCFCYVSNNLAFAGTGMHGHILKTNQP
jgi:photosystem II stability/assembly factor-like uncharacterized protein